MGHFHKPVTTRKRSLYSLFSWGGQLPAHEDN